VGFVHEKGGTNLINGQFSVDQLSKLTLICVCDTQRLIYLMDAFDAELGLTFHGGVPSTLNINVKSWISRRQGKAASNRQAQQDRVLRQFGPDVMCDIFSIAELRERVAAELAEIICFCRFLIGRQQYDLDFSHIWLTVKKGVVRDLFIGRRLFIAEIPGLEAFDAMMRDTRMFQDTVK